MLHVFAGWEVRIVKNCDQGLEDYITVTVVRDRKIRTALRTNQIRYCAHLTKKEKNEILLTSFK